MKKKRRYTKEQAKKHGKLLILLCLKIPVAIILLGVVAGLGASYYGIVGGFIGFGISAYLYIKFIEYALKVLKL